MESSLTSKQGWPKIWSQHLQVGGLFFSVPGRLGWPPSQEDKEDLQALLLKLAWVTQPSAVCVLKKFTPNSGQSSHVNWLVLSLFLPCSRFINLTKVRDAQRGADPSDKAFCANHTKGSFTSTLSWTESLEILENQRQALCSHRDTWA